MNIFVLTIVNLFVIGLVITALFFLTKMMQKMFYSSIVFEEKFLAENGFPEAKIVIKPLEKILVCLMGISFILVQAVYFIGLFYLAHKLIVNEISYLADMPMYVNYGLVMALPFLFLMPIMLISNRINIIYILGMSIISSWNDYVDKPQSLINHYIIYFTFLAVYAVTNVVIY